MVKKTTGKSGRPEDSASRDALMRWLTTPGNATRWHTGDRNALCREIMNSLLAQGLAARKETYVRYKLGTLQKQYLSAKSWLLHVGRNVSYENGTADAETNAQVEALCPNYRQLAAVLNTPGKAGLVREKREKREVTSSVGDVTGTGATTTNGSVKAEEKPSGDAVAASGTTAATGTKVEAKEEPDKKLPPAPIPSKTGKRAAKAPVSALRSPSRKRRDSSTLSDQWVSMRRGNKTQKVDGDIATAIAEEAARQLAKEEREQQHELFLLKRAILENELNAKRTINENEVKARRAMTQRELKAKQAKLGVQLACEKLLARQKLLDAGVNPADIENAL